MTRSGFHRFFPASLSIVLGFAGVTQAGPLPTEVLARMRERTKPRYEQAVAAVAMMQDAMHALDKGFLTRYENGEFKDMNAYNDALGEYFDAMAELQAESDAALARVQRLAEHLEFIEAQQAQWDSQNSTDDNVRASRGLEPVDTGVEPTAELTVVPHSPSAIGGNPVGPAPTPVHPNKPHDPGLADKPARG